MKIGTANRASALLLLAGLFTAAVGCASSDPADVQDQQDTKKDSAVVTETEVLDERQKVSDDLPEKDFNGKTYRIMLREDYEYEFDVEQQNGETINDAVYNRNLKIAERYNITYENTAYSAVWNSGVFNKAISNSVLAGDNAFDIVVGYMCDITPTITQGIYLNWYDIPYINPEKPWWAELMTESFTINDRIYMITGDLALSFWKNISGIAFNKGLAASYDMEDIYSVVRDGRWTFEYMENLCRQISTDVNGDGTWDENDRYGYVTNASTGVDALKEAFDLHITVKDDNGDPVLDVANDKAVGVLEALSTFSKEHGWILIGDNGDNKSGTIFIEDRALMLYVTFKTVETLRDMDTDFGIIPFPKWDEAQKDYGSTVCDNASVFLVPKTVDDTEFVGIITEALAAESYKTVVPAYYDVVLKTKASRDEDSAEMIDLIRDTIVIDFGYIHSSALNFVGHIFVNQVRAGTTNIVSAFKADEKAAQAKLDAIVSFYYEEE